MASDVLFGFSGERTSDGTRQSCGAKQPCEVTKLTLTDAASGRSVTTSQSWHGAPPPANAPKRLHGDLGHYDLVLEVVADRYRPGPTPPGNVVKLQVDAVYAADCGADHPLVRITGKADDRDNGTWKRASVPPAKLLAAQVPGTNYPLTSFFGAIWFPGDGTRELEVVADSHGVLPGAPKLNQLLTGLVRVYEKSTFSFTLKAPPWKKLKAERKVTKLLGAGETQSVKGSTIEKHGYTEKRSATEKTTNTKEGTSLTKTTIGEKQTDGYYRELSEDIGKKKGSDYYAETDVLVAVSGKPVLQKKETIKDVDSTEEARKLDYEAEYVVRPGVSIKHNGKELNCTQAVSNVLNKLTSFREKVIKPLKDIKEWVPKVGWSADIDISFLDGSIIADWGQELAPQPAGARFTCVERTYKIVFSIDLAKIAASVQFGLECKSPDILNWFGDTLYEIIALAKLSLELKARLETTLAARSLDPASAPKPVVATSSVTPDLSVQGRVHLAGYTLVDTKFGATGEFSAVYEVEVSFSKAPTMTMEGKNTEIYAYAQWYDMTSKKPPSPQWKHLMVAESATGKMKVF